MNDDSIIFYRMKLDDAIERKREIKTQITLLTQQYDALCEIESEATDKLGL